MWLSELKGRLEQLLNEHGDMRVVRERSLKIDGIIGNALEQFIDYNSECFAILKDYKCKQETDNTVILTPAGKRLVIQIPF